MENKILEACLNSREFYNDLSALGSISEDLSGPGRIIFECIEKFYNEDPSATRVDIGLVIENIKVTYKYNNDALILILKEMDRDTVSFPNLLKSIVEIKREAKASQIVAKLSSLNNKSSKEVYQLMDEYMHIDSFINTKEKESVITGSNMLEFMEEVHGNEEIIKIYPLELNNRVDGRLLKGNHVIVIARPNAGKTMFVINLVRGLLRDGRKVLHIANEEPRKQILVRLLSRLTGKRYKEVVESVEETINYCRENRNLDNYFLEEMSPGTFKEINSLTEKIRPDVLIVDQIRALNMHVEGKTETLERAAEAMRNVAKKNNVLVVSVTQAGASASNKLVLSMDDVADIKTGLQGAADLIVGIGVNEDMKESNRRMISICKNKVTDDHGYFPVRVDESLSKIIS